MTLTLEALSAASHSANCLALVAPIWEALLTSSVVCVRSTGAASSVL